MPKEKTKTIHVGLTEAKRLGKSLFDYLTEDVEELTDVQQTYVIGYQDGIRAVLGIVEPHMKEIKEHIDHSERILAECIETKPNSGT
jgi:protein-tyrosine phosphatase